MEFLEIQPDYELIGRGFMKWVNDHRAELNELSEQQGLTIDSIRAIWEDIKNQNTQKVARSQETTIIASAIIAQDFASFALADKDINSFLEFILHSKELIDTIDTRREEQAISKTIRLAEKKLQAKINAKKSHKENYAMREEVMKFWRENIDPSLSNEAAADIVVAKNIVPLKHRTIKSYIAIERKKTSSK